jgi:hypothetical protein
MLNRQLKLEVICTNLPGIRFGDRQGAGIKEPVYLGIQFGKDVIHQVPADRRQVTFHPEFTVARKPDGSPNFLGPYAQGKADDRFFYLSWGIKRESGEFEMFRRLKIRLGHLDWPQIHYSLKSGKPIIVRLKLTDEKGGPLCATPRDSHLAWES